MKIFKRTLFCLIMAILFGVLNIPAYHLIKDKSNVYGTCVYGWTKQHFSKTSGYYNVDMSVVVDDGGYNAYVLNTNCKDFNRTKKVPWEISANGFIVIVAFAMVAIDGLILIVIGFLILIGIGLLIEKFFKWAFK